MSKKNLKPEEELYKPQGNRITVLLPPGSRSGDEFESITMSCPVGEWNIQTKDICIVYITKDVRKDDLVLISTKSGCQYIGQFDSDDFYLHLLESDDYEGESFHRTQARVVGRVVEVRRNGILIDIPRLRPIRDVVSLAAFRETLPRIEEPDLPQEGGATIYQFSTRQKGGRA